MPTKCSEKRAIRSPRRRWQTMSPLVGFELGFVRGIFAAFIDNMPHIWMPQKFPVRAQAEIAACRSTTSWPAAADPALPDRVAFKNTAKRDDFPAAKGTPET